MLDRFATPLLRPPLQAIARVLVRAGVGANTVTLAGFAVGMLAAILIATGAYSAGAIALLASRLLDGLDGAVARETQPQVASMVVVLRAVVTPMPVRAEEPPTSD